MSLPDPLADPLPDPLPADPLALAAEWLALAWQRRDQPNPNAMVLATSTPDGRPSARVVLCKGIEPDPGCVRFVSNYHSRKGRELAANPRAAAVLHFDALHRQVRLEGVDHAREHARTATPTSRRAPGRAGSARMRSEQSAAGRVTRRRCRRNSTSRSPLRCRAAAPGRDIPRPDHWGGYVLWIDRAELWVEGGARLHDRAEFRRDLRAVGEQAFAGGAVVLDAPAALRPRACGELLRIGVLLTVLGAVVVPHATPIARVVEWRSPLWVGVFPLAGDDSPATRA